MDTLFEEYKDKELANSGVGYFINYLNILEGYKTKIKNLHWAAFGLNIHVKLDDLLGTLDGYQDSIAEDCMGIYGKMAPNVISGVACSHIDPLSTLEGLKEKVITFYDGLEIKAEMSGIKSETEVFIHDLNKFTYLFKLAKG